MAISVVCECGQRFAAKESLAGKLVKCPKCGGPLRIPAPPVVEPPAAGSGAIPPGDDYALESPAIGGPAQPRQGSPSLGDLFDEAGIGTKHDAGALRTGGVRCPGCAAILPAGAVLCVQCGYNLELGRKLETKRVRERKPSENPYASPSEWEDLEGQYGRRGGLRNRNDEGRDGPPWEYELPLVSRYFRTLVNVFTAPIQTFEHMSRRSGMGPPMTFTLTTYGAFMICQMAIAFAALFMGFRFIPCMPAGKQGELAALGFCFMVAAIMIFVVVMSVASVFIVIALMLQAAFSHLALFMVGGAKENFEVTFRASSYVFGAMALPELLLTLIPNPPPILYSLPSIPFAVYLGLALKGSHQIAMWQGLVAGVLGIVMLNVAVIAAVLLSLEALGIPAVDLYFGT